MVFASRHQCDHEEERASYLHNKYSLNYGQGGASHRFLGSSSFQRLGSCSGSRKRPQDIFRRPPRCSSANYWTPECWHRTLRWAGDSLRGVTCLRPYVATTDASTLPVTPKGMKWLTKEENYVKDEKICTFNHLSFVWNAIWLQLLWDKPWILTRSQSPILSIVP